MPTKHTYEIIDYLHKLTHLGPKKMKTLLDRQESGQYLLNRDGALQKVTDKCQACAQVNAGRIKLGPGVRVRLTLRRLSQVSMGTDTSWCS